MVKKSRSISIVLAVVILCTILSTVFVSAGSASLSRHQLTAGAAKVYFSGASTGIALPAGDWFNFDAYYDGFVNTKFGVEVDGAVSAETCTNMMEVATGYRNNTKAVKIKGYIKNNQSSAFWVEGGYIAW